MELTTREQLLGLTSRRYKTVPIAGLKFRIRNLSEAEKSDFEASVLNSEAKYSLSKIRQQRRRLICLCLVDDHNRAAVASGGQLSSCKAIDGAGHQPSCTMPVGSIAASRKTISKSW
jgi:hypothetical protein